MVQEQWHNLFLCILAVWNIYLPHCICTWTLKKQNKRLDVGKLLHRFWSGQSIVKKTIWQETYKNNISIKKGCMSQEICHFALIRHIFNLCFWLYCIDNLLINLSVDVLPWSRIVCGRRKHLVAYAAGTGSKATACQL